MAKKSKIAKAKKQQAMIAKYAPIRQALKEAGDYEGLSKLPKDAPSKSLKTPRSNRWAPTWLHA